jgi:hypothetical protein
LGVAFLTDTCLLWVSGQKKEKEKEPAAMSWSFNLSGFCGWCWEVFRKLCPELCVALWDRRGAGRESLRAAVPPWVSKYQGLQAVLWAPLCLVVLLPVRHKLGSGGLLEA